MKIRTLECFCEIAENGFNLSNAARSLNATQPALTHQIKMLEEELGFPVLLRRGNKAVGLTEGGRIVYERAQTIINESRQLGLLKEQLSNDSKGKLVIATTQFHARYTLLPAIIKFRPAHPHVSLSIVSGDPASAAQLVLSGNADFALCGEVPDKSSQLETFLCFEVRRLVIVPRGHPLTKSKRLSLKQIASYPLIVYDAPFSGGRQVLSVFEEHGIKPEVALNAMDSDVIKAYVGAGIGIAVIQELAYDKSDAAIEALDPGNLFRPTKAFLMLRKGAVVRAFTREFISLLAPGLTPWKSTP
jgi:LysR family transcriptional regulator, cys regulon transcriptional activator